MLDFNIGDSITGNFNASDLASFNANKVYQIYVRDSKLYLKYKHKETVVECLLTPFDNDRDAHKILDKALKLTRPVLRINKVSKTHAIIFLFLYAKTQEITGNQSLHFFYDSLKEKEILATTMHKGDVSEILYKLFSFEENFFVRMNDANQKVIELIGNHYRLVAQQELNAKSLYQVKKFSRIQQEARQSFNRNIVQLHGNIHFIKKSKLASVLSQTMRDTNIVEKAPSKFVNYWKAYHDIEQEAVFAEALNFGSFKIKSIVETAFYFDFLLDEEVISNHSLDHRSNHGIALSQVPLNDDYLKNFVNQGNRFSQLHVCDKYTVLSDRVRVRIDDIIEEDLDKIKDFPLQEAYLVYSLTGFMVNHNRKRKELKKLTDQNAGLIKDLIINQSVQSLLSFSNMKVVSKKLIEKTFGTSNYSFTENQIEALNIAINTPDIALIQGPPGTGKTLIIKAIIHRINEVSKKDVSPKILVSCEQHEALKNVTSNVNEGLPPKTFSTRRGESEKDAHRHVIDFKDKLAKTLKDVVPNQDKREHTRKLFFQTYLDLRDPNLTARQAYECIDKLRSLTKTHLTQNHETIEHTLSSLSFKLSRQWSHQKPITELEKLLKSQRTLKEAYEDDGEAKLHDLFWLLEALHPEDYALGENLYLELAQTKTPSNEQLAEFEQFIDLLKHKHGFTKNSSTEDQNIQELLDSLRDDFLKLLDNEPKSREEILAEFVTSIENPLALKLTIENYSPVYGSTAQQSAKIKKIEDNIWFDYVIIDEASRVNPVDLLIPMMLGERVILVGDQAQLPHYIEEQLITKVEKKITKNDVNVSEILKTSLFQNIFELLEDMYQQNKIEKRHVVLDTQYRMHPTIGKFISTEFYNNRLRTGLTKEERTPTFGVADNKPIAWYDISASYGMEIGSTSRKRPVEIECVFSLIDKIVQDNVSNMPSLGVISYYKGQINELEEQASKRYPPKILDSISFGTVDSFQGKEFDIVILSIVRSNNHPDKRKRIGFLNNAKSRINVSFSRAKYQMIVVGDSKTVVYKNDVIVNEHLHNFLLLVKQEGYYHDKKD